MDRKTCLWAAPGVAAALILAPAAWAPAAPQQETKTTTQTVKEKLGDAVSTIKKEAASAGEAIKDQFAKAKNAVRAMNIESRVYARLHWDKALTGAKIDLHAPKPGVIALTGTVPDAKARARAVELTNDTVGVTQVEDRLTVLTSVEGAARP